MKSWKIGLDVQRELKMEGPGSMREQPLGLILVAAGALLLVVGLLVWSGLLSWVGRLPGDIRIERPGTRIYIPITSMVLLSVVLSLLFAVLRRIR